MSARLFEIDPYAGVQYAMYSSIKKDEGNFLDFLLQYDSHGVNKGDSSWLTKLVTSQTSASLSSPEFLEMAGWLGVSTQEMLLNTSTFDTQVSAYKLQLQLEIAKRNASK